MILIITFFILRLILSRVKALDPDRFVTVPRNQSSLRVFYSHHVHGALETEADET